MKEVTLIPSGLNASDGDQEDRQPSGRGAKILRIDFRLVHGFCIADPGSLEGNSLLITDRSSRGGRK